MVKMRSIPILSLSAIIVAISETKKRIVTTPIRAKDDLTEYEDKRVGKKKKRTKKIE